MKIKFLDLNKNYKNIKEEITNKINTLLENTDFIKGEDVSKFENNFAKYIGSKYCIGVANGTDALEIAIKSLNLPPNSEIITQANTFISTCFSITNNNHKLVLVDCNEDNYMINVDKIEKKITKNTKAIIPVHLYGYTAAMDKIINIAKKYNLYIIEDCAQAHGASYMDRKVGTFGDIGCFSFYPGKNLGAYGDAGCIITNNENLYKNIKLIHNLGSEKKYYHIRDGRNSRLDTLQAAVLNIKLEYLDIWNTNRTICAELYDKYLHDVIEIELPNKVQMCKPVYHLYVIKTKTRDKLREFLAENNIETGIHYPICIPYTEVYSNIINNKEEYINSKVNSEQMLSLPMYPELTELEIKYVCNHIKKFYKNII